MEMQEKKLKRFNVYAIIAKVLFVITIVIGVLGLIIAIVAEGILIANGTELIGEFQQFITNRGYDIIIPFTEVPHLAVVTGFIFMLSGIALAAFIFQSISMMFRNIVNNKTPFHLENVKRIKSMGIGLFIFAGIQFILSIIMSRGILDIMGQTPGMGNTSINWTIIGFGVLLLALAEMFEFGANLQQDSSSIV